MFVGNIKMALKAAGVRFKPMPRRRKQRLRIKRRRAIEWQAHYDATLGDNELMSIRNHYDEVTGLTFQIMKFKKKDGTVTEHYGLPMLFR